MPYIKRAIGPYLGVWVSRAWLFYRSRRSTRSYRYNNYLMACTALYEQDVVPQYSSLLDQGRGPGIRALQGVIERAWNDGKPQA